MKETPAACARRSGATLLLRVWSEGEEWAPVRRYSVEDPCTREKRGFASFTDLVLFLAEFTDVSGDRSPCQGRPAGPDLRTETLRRRR
jgi:hypothetical protein